VVAVDLIMTMLVDRAVLELGDMFQELQLFKDGHHHLAFPLGAEL
jgi:hypothetical protein